MMAGLSDRANDLAEVALVPHPAVTVLFDLGDNQLVVEDRAGRRQRACRRCGLLCEICCGKSISVRRWTTDNPAKASVCTARGALQDGSALMALADSTGGSVRTPLTVENARSHLEWISPPSSETRPLVASVNDFDERVARAMT